MPSPIIHVLHVVGLPFQSLMTTSGMYTRARVGSWTERGKVAEMVDLDCCFYSLGQCYSN